MEHLQLIKLTNIEITVAMSQSLLITVVMNMLVFTSVKKCILSFSLLSIITMTLFLIIIHIILTINPIEISNNIRKQLRLQYVLYLAIELMSIIYLLYLNEKEIILSHRDAQILLIIYFLTIVTLLNSYSIESYMENKIELVIESNRIVLN